MSNNLASKFRPAVTQHEGRHPKLGLVADEPVAQIWSPPARAEGVVITDHAMRVPLGTLPAEIEAKLIVTLTRPIDPADGHAAGAVKRESELRAQLAALDIPQSFHLKRRLEGNRAGDPLCAAFQRLVADRRQRLLAFVGDARCRIAVGAR